MVRKNSIHLENGNGRGLSGDRSYACLGLELRGSVFPRRVAYTGRFAHSRSAQPKSCPKATVSRCVSTMVGPKQMCG